MGFPRHHHLYINFKCKNQIICVGGSKIKMCEIYDIESNSWTNLAELNNSRECPSACVTDKNYLYVFFGFDKNVNKYVSNIERLNLENPNKFEILNLKGNQNILKKHSAATLQIETEKILIFGGINSLRNPCKDVLIYDIKNNSAQLFKLVLPFNTSFHNCEFIDLNLNNEILQEKDVSEKKGIETDNILYNFTDDFKVVALNKENFNLEVIE